MFFRGRLIKRYEAEIEFLHEQNKELLNRIMALTNRDAFWDFKQSEEKIEAPKFIDPMGIMRNMEAKTEEEQKEKKESLKFYKSMFGG